MKRRFALLAAVVAAAAFTATIAQAATPGPIVHVRVEGKTTTLFGAAEPRAMAANALQALEAASLGGELYYHVAHSSFGDYVDQVGRYGGAGASGWVFKVNGASPPVGADKVQLKDGDTVLWYYATFGAAGGPATLSLRAAAQAGCYQVSSFDDAGKATTPAAATLAVDGRSVAVKEGVGCPGAHRGLVRAVAPGAVRSNALR